MTSVQQVGDAISAQTSGLEVTIDLRDIPFPACLRNAKGIAVWQNAKASPVALDQVEPVEVRDAVGDRLRLHVAPAPSLEALSIERLAEREGEHRAKNIISLALAIGHQSLGSRLNDPVVQRFLDRLRSLDAVARIGCEVEGDRCELLAMAKKISNRFDDPERSRIVIDGPAVTIPRRWAQLLAIVIHELGANAIRHGALRDRSGIVHLRWSIVVNALAGQSVLHISWRESGGLAVGVPGVRGFGSRILRDIASVSNRCRAVFRLPVTGLDYQLEITFSADEIIYTG